ncbi:MAG: hypothetical protein RLZZ397_1392 [Pseudomonadota bacterium]|jgi:ubiquinol-cytochrome c reductase cytochrome c1 subunit
MKKFLISLMLGCSVVATAQASSGADIKLDKAPYLLEDQQALQRGAKIFVDNCLSCHSAAYMRFNRLRDIGLTDKQIMESYNFITPKVGDMMVSPIDPKQAKEWFGANPPDLTVIARSRASGAGSGADYLYSFLRGFYVDETKPTGWNNHVFPSVGMPNVLWNMQSTMAPEQFDSAVADLVAYLQWMGEPVQLERQALGKYVVLFILLLIFVTWRLSKAYWKDVK